jgi:hypothetical protein
MFYAKGLFQQYHLLCLVKITRTYIIEINAACESAVDRVKINLVFSGPLVRID